MARNWWIASLATAGLVIATSALSPAQTISKPAIDVGPSLMPASTDALPPAPVVSAPPSNVPAVLSSTPPMPLTSPRPATSDSKPSTTSIPSRKATSFADSATVIIPTDSKSVPTLPAPKPLPSTPIAPTKPIPGVSTSAPKPTMIVPPVAAPVTAEPPMPMPPLPGTTIGSSGGPALPEPKPTITSVETKPAPAADDFTPKLKFKVGDNNLLQVETANGLFKVYVGGRVQIDAAWFRASEQVQAPRTAGGVGDIGDAVNFRRARFDIGGTFYKNVEFLMEFDLINTTNAERTGNILAVNTPAPTDLWVTFKEVPFIGNVRIGNQKPPIAFEHITSSRFLNFMERSLSFDAFIENQNNGFEPGISAFDNFLDKRGLWQFGVFKNTRSVFGWNVGDGEYDVTGRVAFLPIYDNDGENLVHVAVGASHRDFDDHFDRIRARTLIRNGPAVLHNIVAEVQTLGDSRDQVVPEFVVVWGPWTIQSEYYHVWVHNATTPVTGTGPRTNYGTVQYQGAYAEVLYFLTGEHQKYDHSRGAFTRVTPNQSFRGFGTDADGCDECSEEYGFGAWQLGVRYSWLDLNDRGIQGSTCQDLTVGLNWFLNPYMKWQWNYSMLYRDAPGNKNDGWIYGFGTRIAIDF